MLISSVGKDGSKFIIGLTKTGPAEAQLRLLTWKPGNNNKRPNTDDKTPLYGIKVGDAVTCFARVFGPDPVVTLKLDAASIKVTVAGALAHNGTSTYPLDPDEVEEILAFLKAANYPKDKSSETPS